MTSMDAVTAPPNSIHPLTRAEWRAWLEENHGGGECSRQPVAAVG